MSSIDVLFVETLAKKTIAQLRYLQNQELVALKKENLFLLQELQNKKCEICGSLPWANFLVIDDCNASACSACYDIKKFRLDKLRTRQDFYFS